MHPLLRGAVGLGLCLISGMGWSHGRCPAAEPLAWREVAGTRIPVPSPAHPRLYLRGEHVRALPERLADPRLASSLEVMEGLARRSTQFRIEWDALHALAQGDQARARQVIDSCLAELPTVELPDENDACRYTGRWMVTGALVYDWFHPLLSAAEKQIFIRELVRLAKTQECGYPPVRQGAITSHASEAMILRDMVSAGIAVYDEFPELYEQAAARIFREHIPARNWLYRGHAHHQGDSYGPYRFQWEAIALWIFDRMGAGRVFSEDQRFVPYYYLYATRPDGQRLRGGDTYLVSRTRGEPWPEGIGTLLMASYDRDPILMGHFQRQGVARGDEVLFDVLWRDLDVPAQGPEELPLTRYFGPPFGWMIARDGWDANATIVEMKLNEYNFANHQHLDAGAFQIYHQGALAVDSGVYTGSSGRYGSPHNRNYSWRSIAHNTISVWDPAEQFKGRDYGNDGGQRLPNGRSETGTLESLLDPAHGYQTGEILAHGFGPDPVRPAYSLLEGDLSRAYNPAKATAIKRSFACIRTDDANVPIVLVVYDALTRSDPTFRTAWLLHSLEEPRLEDSQAAVVDVTAHGARGRLFLDVLMPETGQGTLIKVGGPGHEFQVGDTNYANDLTTSSRQGSSEPGAWRIESVAGDGSPQVRFLHVMQVSDQSRPDRWPTRLIKLPTHLGCQIDGPEARWITLFGQGIERCAEALTIDVPGDRPARVLVAGLEAGPWRATPLGGGPATTAAVTDDAGAFWFEAAPGRWRLERLAQAQR